jgi:hypothetical protein
MEGIVLEVSPLASEGVYSLRVVLLGRVWTLTHVAEADFEGMHRTASACLALGTYAANDATHHAAMLRQVFSQAFATAVPNPVLMASVQEFLNTKSGADGLSAALLMAQITYLQSALLAQATQFSSLNSRLVELENERSVRDAGGKSSGGEAAGIGGGASAQQHTAPPGPPPQTDTPTGSPSLKSRSKEQGPPLPTSTYKNWAHPYHICSRTGLAPFRHLHRSLTRTWLAPDTSARGLGLTPTDTSAPGL